MEPRLVVMEGYRHQHCNPVSGNDPQTSVACRKAFGFPSQVTFRTVTGHSEPLDCPAIMLQGFELPGPPLWSSDQSSWLQIQRSGFNSRRYQIF
jgi:hypothetical protein